MDDKLLKQISSQPCAMDHFPATQHSKGFVRVFAYDPKTREVVRMVDGPNLITYSGADLMATCLSGDATYAVKGMYFEFKNLTLPADAIVAPTYTRSGGIDYYNALADPYDVIRVPLTVSPAFSSSDATKYDMNQVTFYAATEGTAGAITSLAFNSLSNSAVFGVGLVATPDWNTQASDVVFARTYVDKVLKADNYEIGCAWVVRCT